MKKLLTIVLAVLIIFTATQTFAATDEYAVERLEELGFVGGCFDPEKTITRAEMVVILCKMVGVSSIVIEENANVPSKFIDIEAAAWYAGYINVVEGMGLLENLPVTEEFFPDKEITMNEVLTLCVNALGRGEYVTEMGTWPANYIAEATKLGLLDGVKTSDANRGNVAIIVWNTLEAPYVWEVTNSEFEGSINLQNSNKSLLEIYLGLKSPNCGDVNRDGEVNALDATQILRFANNKPSTFDKMSKRERLVHGDVNKDGEVNALDATQILRFANNKPSVF